MIASARDSDLPHSPEGTSHDWDSASDADLPLVRAPHPAILDADPAARVTPGEVSRLEEHLATCEKCTQVVAEHRALHRTLSLWSGGTTVDPRSVDRVRDFLFTINDEDNS